MLKAKIDDNEADLVGMMYRSCKKRLASITENLLNENRGVQKMAQ